MTALLVSNRPVSSLTGIGIFCGKVFCPSDPEIVVGEVFRLPCSRYELKLLHVPGANSFNLIFSEPYQLRLDGSVEIFNPDSESVGSVSANRDSTTELVLSFSSSPSGIYSFGI